MRVDRSTSKRILISAETPIHSPPRDHAGLTIAQRSTTVPFVDAYSYRSVRVPPTVASVIRPNPYVVPRTSDHAGVGVIHFESMIAPLVAWLM